ncbi:MAG: hypothetical protein AB7I42_29935 [Bradyrhizobium sp.]|uniref:hypothetical protein n=1 Tax=Bradyrhizobium sp. TaxID=376 RepID=UPI003D0CC958
MDTRYFLLSGIMALVWPMIGASMDVNADHTATWKEEVLLHDGATIIAERHEIRAGRHEIGQSPPIKEHSITFTPPGADRSITWVDEYSKDIGHANFTLIAIHILKGKSYIVAEPYLCTAYNKWGRPNPPYILFEYLDGAWRRISIEELPMEFRHVNVVVNTSREDDVKESGSKTGIVPIASINKLNSSIKQVRYQTIIRSEIKNAGAGCPELIRTEKGWESPGGAKSPIPIKPSRSSTDINTDN